MNLENILQAASQEGVEIPSNVLNFLRKHEVEEQQGTCDLLVAIGQSAESVAFTTVGIATLFVYAINYGRESMYRVIIKTERGAPVRKATKSDVTELQDTLKLWFGVSAFSLIWKPFELYCDQNIDIWGV